MARPSNRRSGISRTIPPSKDWYSSRQSRNQSKQTEDSGDWVGSSLLTAMDRMEGHVEEMLNPIVDPVKPPSSPAMPSAVDTATIKTLIKQEFARRLDDTINNIVDTAITERLQQLGPAQKLDRTNINALQILYDHERRTLEDLDALHRHEHLLNSALVERLFEAASLEGDADARFEETTFGLQGTDSVNSVLVSHIEKLVAKVAMLEKRLEELQRLSEIEKEELQ